MLEDDQVRNNLDTLRHLPHFFAEALNGDVDDDMIIPEFNAIIPNAIANEQDEDARTVTRQEDL
jgi:hypothetical protein